MSGGYRHVGAALAGLAALFCTLCLGLYIGALNYPKEQRYETYRYGADKPVEVDPALLGQADPEALKKREPCKEPKGRDESDLCAQWKAARAAETGALWTERGFWITAAGIIGLIATLIQGRIALNKASEANRIASDTAKQQLSAYLDIKRVSYLGAKNAAKPRGLKIVLTNHGATEARRIVISKDITVKVGNDPIWLGDPHTAQIPSVAGNGNANYRILLPTIPANIWESVVDGAATITLTMKISYETIFAESRNIACDYSSQGTYGPFVIIV